MAPKKGVVALNFRLPADLHGEVIRWAKPDMLSLNAALIQLVREGLKHSRRRSTS